MSLYIYDRHGKLIFKSNNPLEGWDGTYKGKKLPPSTYAYALSVEALDGVLQEQNGTFTLLR